MPNEKYEVGLVLRAFDKVTGPLKQINSSLKEFQAPIRRFNNAFVSFADASGANRLIDSFSRIGGAVKNVGSQMVALGTKFTLFGAIAAGALAKAVDSTTEWASGIHDLSDATGASKESIQTLGFALRQAGGKPEDFEAGLKKFANALAQARKGAGPLVETMKKIDPKGLKEILKAKDTGQGLRLFVNSLAKAKSDPARFAAALKVMGKAAAAPFAVLGKEGPEALAKAESSIIAFTDSQIDKTEAMGDTVGGVFEQLKLMGRSFIIEAAPVLDEFFKGLSGTLSANKGQVLQWARSFGEQLPGRLENLKKAFQSFWESLKPVRDFLKWITEDSTRLKVAFTVLAAIIAAPLIKAVGILTLSVIKLGIALFTTPVGWFTLLLAGMILSFVLLYKNVKTTGKLLIAAFEDAKGPAKTLYDTVRAILDLITFGPIKRFLSGESFDPLKKFREIRVEEPGNNLRRAWDDAIKEQEKESKWFQGLTGMGEESEKSSTNIWSGLKKSFSPQASPAAVPEAEAPKDFSLKDFQSHLAPQVVTRDSEITIRFENAPPGTRADVTKNDGNKIKVDLPLGLQLAGRPS